MKNMKQSKGITLVSLVITIVILLILATISIQSLTHTGLFAQAENAKIESKRAQIIEWLNLKLMEQQTKNPTGTPEELIEATRKASYGNKELAKMGKNVVVDESTSTIEDGEQVDAYFYVQVDEDIYKVDKSGVKYIGEQGKFPPVITIENIESTTNSITIKIKVSRNKEGKLELYIKPEDDENYKCVKTATGEESNGLEYTFSGLEQNKNYSIKIVATAKNGQIKEYMKNIPLGSVPSGEKLISFTPVIWENGKASTTISTTEKSYALQYQINNTLENGWITGTTVTGLMHNDKLYARFWDGINGGTIAAINILDNTDPIAKIELSSTNTTTKDTVTATITHSDDESGINIEKCKWVYNTISSDLGTNESDYTGGTFSTNPQTISLNIATAGTYYLHVLTVDVAGRLKETVSNGIVVEKKGAVYGTSIQSNYETLYTTDYPNGYNQQPHYSVYNGNYSKIYDICGESVNSIINIISNSSTNFAYVYSGTHTYSFTENVKNNWIGIYFRCGGLTTGVYISGVKLNFNDGSSYTVNDAVSNGYIEPLVLCASVSSSTSYLWYNFFNIINGGSCNSANFPEGALMFKVKDKADITGITFYTNTSWSTKYDGLRVYKYNKDYEISTEPLN